MNIWIHTTVKHKLTAFMQVSRERDAASHSAKTLYRDDCHFSLLRGPHFVKWNGVPMASSCSALPDCSNETA
jgi:hypothetical protein